VQVSFAEDLDRGHDFYISPVVRHITAIALVRSITKSPASERSKKSVEEDKHKKHRAEEGAVF